MTEHIAIEVPAIIDRSEFEAVAATLKAHNPRVTPARVVSGPILLTGLATCAACNRAMTLRTGTSKSGKVHRYYACSTSGRQGKAGCPGQSIPMDKLDTLVTDHLVSERLQSDRLRATLASLWATRAEKAAEVDGRAASLRAEMTAAEDKLKRLYRMVEDGITDLDDILRSRLAALKDERDRATAALDRVQVTERPGSAIAPELVAEFGDLLRTNITADDIPFRKAWLQAIVDRIEIDDTTVRIVGDKSNLEWVVQTGAAPGQAGVRSSVHKWYAQGESNPCLRRERAPS